MSKHFQQVLRDIVLLPEAPRGGITPEGKPVPPAQGEYWFDGKNGGGGGTDDTKPKPKPKDPKKPQPPGSPPMNPKDTPENGDDASGIGPFYPCDGQGNCVNLRLDGMALPPEGWKDACTPPDNGADDDDMHPVCGKIDKNRYFTYTLQWGGQTDKGAVRCPQQVAQKMKSFFPSDAVESYGTYGYDKSGRWAMQSIYDHFMGGDWGGRSGASARVPPYQHSEGWSASVSLAYCDRKPDPICLEKPPVLTRWPPSQCSELIATPDGFQAACEQHDPSLPPNLRGGTFTAFELCDENGNPVQVSVDDVRGGWNIDHPDYTAHINSDFKVQGVQRKPKAN